VWQRKQLPMDTDELSKEAYKGIIIEAERFNHDLTLRYGLVADSCKNEQEYLLKAKKITIAIRGFVNDELTDLFFGSPPDKKALHLTLDKILNNITKIEKIPENKRHYEF
jgi:hypothetical protein